MDLPKSDIEVGQLVNGIIADFTKGTGRELNETDNEVRQDMKNPHENILTQNGDDDDDVEDEEDEKSSPNGSKKQKSSDSVIYNGTIQKNTNKHNGHHHHHDISEIIAVSKINTKGKFINQFLHFSFFRIRGISLNISKMSHSIFFVYKH